VGGDAMGWYGGDYRRLGDIGIKSLQKRVYSSQSGGISVGMKVNGRGGVYRWNYRGLEVCGYVLAG